MTSPRTLHPNMVVRKKKLIAFTKKSTAQKKKWEMDSVVRVSHINVNNEDFKKTVVQITTWCWEHLKHYDTQSSSSRL